MKELPPRVYMFFGEAVSDSPDSGFEPGSKQSIIAFAAAQNIEEGAEIAAEHFFDAGWTDVSFTEGEQFDLDRLDGDDVDENVAATCRECLSEGSSGIVFRTVDDE